MKDSFFKKTEKHLLIAFSFHRNDAPILLLVELQKEKKIADILGEPSLISLMASVDAKPHVYLLFLSERRLRNLEAACSFGSLFYNFK